MKNKTNNNEKMSKQLSFDLDSEMIKPILDHDNRIEPKTILNSSLFTSRNKKQKRKYFENAPLAVAPGYGSIHYRGQELRVYDDEDLWLSLLYYAQKLNIHNTKFCLEISAYQLLNELAWGTGGREYERLKNCLGRLKATALQIDSDRYDSAISVSLIERFKIVQAGDLKKAKLQVVFEPEIYKLFTSHNVTKLSWKIRRTLSLLTKKIYEIVMATQEELTVNDYMKLSGAEYKVLRQFKAKLIKSFEELISHKIIIGWGISKDGIVTIERNTQTSLLDKNTVSKTETQDKSKET